MPSLDFALGIALGAVVVALVMGWLGERRATQARITGLESKVAGYEKEIANLNLAKSPLYRSAIEDVQAGTVQALLRLRAVQADLHRQQDEIATTIQLVEVMGKGSK